MAAIEESRVSQVSKQVHPKLSPRVTLDTKWLISHERKKNYHKSRLDCTGGYIVTKASQRNQNVNHMIITVVINSWCDL